MRNEKGFTLIEVMVVIIMIGVLAAVAIPIYSGYIYRARASEGIVFLGAVKTYAMEKRVSAGRWPTKAELLAEFNSFNDLFYFDKNNVELKPSDDPGIIDNIAVKLTATEDFGLPENFDKTMQINISLNSEPGKFGWSGGIVDKYATHLKPFIENPSL
jgi:prepilin-type N-terminal cleavage/methylation domain-containing protein